jgi:hypothetical protein
LVSANFGSRPLALFIHDDIAPLFVITSDKFGTAFFNHAWTRKHFEDKEKVLRAVSRDNERILEVGTDKRPRKI